MNVSHKTWARGEDTKWIMCELDKAKIWTKGINYDPSFASSAQQFIERGVLDTYTIVYRDDQIVGGGGARPDVVVPDIGFCYQIAVRGFRIPQQGLRQDYFVLDTLVPMQVQKGRNEGYDACIMTFNMHNERLVRNLDRFWKFPRKKIEPHIVNGVPQWIYLF